MDARRTAPRVPPPPRLQVWDMRQKRSVKTFMEQYQVTAVAFAEAGDQVRGCACVGGGRVCGRAGVGRAFLQALNPGQNNEQPAAALRFTL